MGLCFMLCLLLSSYHITECIGKYTKWELSNNDIKDMLIVELLIVICLELSMLYYVE